MNREKMAQKLIELRREKDMTQREVAQAIGISESAYSQYETGAKVPRDDLKVIIAQFFNVSIMALFYSDCTHLK